MIKPDSITVQEIKVLPAKAKVSSWFTSLTQLMYQWFYVYVCLEKACMRSSENVDMINQHSDVHFSFMLK